VLLSSQAKTNSENAKVYSRRRMSLFFNKIKPKLTLANNFRANYVEKAKLATLLVNSE
jgi:hypothetical protein